MKTVAYLRVSTRSQDLANQKLAILEFSQKRRFTVDQLIESRVSSRKSPFERPHRRDVGDASARRPSAGQRLLRAKIDLTLEKELKKLDRFEALIVDDIGYVQQSREEMEVLFTLLAHRYERRSILLTSNLIFSDWERIFKDPLTTAAAIDRLVHHSVILELNVPSYRMESAKAKQQGTTK